MTSNSSLKKYIHKDLRGREIDIPNLYRDENTLVFYARVYNKGSVKTRSLETDNFSIARSRLLNKIKEVKHEKIKKDKNKLVREYCEDLFKIHESKGTSVNSMKRYKNTWKLSLEPFWGDMVAADITQQQIANYIRWQKKNRGTQLFTDFKVLQQIVRLMVSSGESILALDFSLPKAEKNHHLSEKGTYITQEELKSILEKTDDDRFKFIFELSYTTGMRKGECIRIRKSYISKKNGLTFIALPEEITKTRRSRTIPLTKSLAEKIASIAKESDDYLFPKKSDPATHIPEQLADRAWRVAKSAAKIKRRIRFHDLRHTCATNLASSGADIFKASVLLGMSVRIYERVYVKKNKIDVSDLLAGTRLK